MNHADLIERSGLGLARAIRRREVSAREVVEAHIARLSARPWLNAVTVGRFEAALADADVADTRVAAAGPDDELPPYLGVPCTIKGSLAVACVPHAGGEVRRRDLRPAQDAPAAARMLATGAILLGVTNTPELALHWETDNRLYGRTSNAYDRRRTAGGSSGGEGAAIGAGGSVFGLATDIGGSIRIPAALNGVFGHMPSRGLVPRTGHHVTPDGAAAEMLRIGPMARRAADLMPLLRAIAGPDPTDPLCRSAPLGDPADVELAGLIVRISTDATYSPARRESRVARARAATALETLGATVTTVSLRALRHATTAYLVALNEGFGTPLGQLLGGVQGPLGILAALRSPEHTAAVVLAMVQERLHALRPRRQVDRILAAGRDLVAELDLAVGDGVLLHPSFPRLAPRHNSTLAQPWLIGGCAVWNLTGLAVTQVPLGRSRCGWPVGVQVVSRHDHVGIRVALELERTFGGWVPPAPP